MTLDQFKNKYLGKQVEYHSYDPRAKYQCVDLANQYITEVWNLEAIIGTDAKDFPEKLKPGMEYVENTPDYLPNPGEVVVWNGKVGGGAGHIAVVLEKGTQLKFNSLDQNWSKPLYVTTETHSYNNVRGFIKKKGESMSELWTYLGVTSDAEAKTKLKEHLGEVNGKSNWGMTGDTGGYLGSERKKNASLQLDVIRLTDKVTGLEASLATCKTDLTSCLVNQPAPTDPEWVANGKQVTTVAGNVTTTVNYAKV